MRPALVFALVLVARVAAATTLEDVRVVEEPGVGVRVRLSGRVAALARTLPADGDRPARIYVDLPGTTLPPGAPTAVDGAGDLLRVRLGQFDPSTVRVVLDLARPTAFRVTDETATLVVDLGPVREEPPQASRETPGDGRPKIVVVDAGHGGHDPGATGVGGVTEKTVALDLARRVAERLTARTDLEVVLTRSDDSFVSIEDRIAHGATASLFLSLHANAASNAAVRGVEVFYGGGGVEPASPGGAPAKRFGGELVRAIRGRGCDVRIVRAGTYGVLARNAAPSVLVEIGYLTNAGDAQRLRDEGYRSGLAEAIADAAARFLREPLRVASR